MHEFNDGLRPNYDEVFDEAIKLNIDGGTLEQKHKETLRRIITGIAKPNTLAIGQEFVITQ